MKKELPSRELAKSILQRHFNINVPDSVPFEDVETLLIEKTKYIDPNTGIFLIFVDEMQRLWQQLVIDFINEPALNFNRKQQIKKVSDMHDILMAGLRLALRYRK